MRVVPSMIAGLLLLAGSAHASSPIPSNYVDDFGSPAPGTAEDAPSAFAAAHSSPIPSNYVDDFGSPAPTTPSRAPAARVASCSPIPSNYIDDFDVDRAIDSSSEVTATAQAPAASPSIPES